VGPRQPARRGGTGREEPDLISLVIAVGRLKSGPEAALCDGYARRLRPPPAVTEIPDGKGAPAEIRRREGAAILAALPANAHLVALDLGGEAVASERLAELTERWEGLGRPLAFALGGAEGLDPAVLARADFRLSLGPMTWPHALARAMLLEQLYRAQCIRAGHPYHRGWRP